MGDAVHGALETIVKALVEAGCESSRAPGAIEVFKSLGGFTALIEQAVTTRLDLIKTNPRVDAERCRRLTRELSDHVADARGQVQEYLSRTKFLAKPANADVPAQGPAEHEPPAFGRHPVGAGAHPEVTLADEICASWDASICSLLGTGTPTSLTTRRAPRIQVILSSFDCMRFSGTSTA
jgi:hypothetical protein